MEKHKVSTKSSAPILAQHFVEAYQTDHQASCTSTNKESVFDVRAKVPLLVDLGLGIHKETRSKSL